MGDGVEVVTAAKPRKAPQDHKAKASEEPVRYRFTWQEQDYELPPPQMAVDRITGQALRDAYMDGQEGQMRLGFLMLENVEAESGAVEALYSMPAPAMLDHIAAWMETRDSETGATVGESLRSVT